MKSTLDAWAERNRHNPWILLLGGFIMFLGVEVGCPNLHSRSTECTKWVEYERTVSITRHTPHSTQVCVSWSP